MGRRIKKNAIGKEFFGKNRTHNNPMIYNVFNKHSESGAIGHLEQGNVGSLGSQCHVSYQGGSIPPMMHTVEAATTVL